MGVDERTNVEITSKDNVAVVFFKDTSISDVDGIEASSRQVNNFIEENRPAGIVFDFGGVKFFSSRVLG